MAKHRKRPVRKHRTRDFQSLEPRIVLTTANQNLVAQAYLDLLNRPADAGGLTYWTGQLDTGGPRGDIARQLTHSAEYFGNIIVAPAYAKLLGRAPDAQGIAYWVDQMQHQGLTDERLEAGFIGSPEFYQHAGGTDKLWVDGMYQDLFGRPADTQGENYWISQLAPPVNESRADVAYGFAASLEREGQRVHGDYEHFLRRAADQAGVTYWVGQFAQGMTNEDLIAGFVASDEYYALAQKPQSAQFVSINITSPAPGVVSATNVTLAGQVSGGDGVLSLSAAVDARSYAPVGLDAAGNFSFTTNLALDGSADGPHTVHFKANDHSGHTSQPTDFSFTLNTSAITHFVVGPAGSNGLGAVVSGTTTFNEGNSLFVQQSVPVTLGGNRTLSFQVQPSFDHMGDSPSGDRFLVYLVDPANRSKTLLDDGTPGSPIFALSDEGPAQSPSAAQFPAGTVQFDGMTVTIDVSSLSSLTSGLLVFQLLNTDADTGGSVAVKGLASTPLTAATNPLPGLATTAAVQPGAALDLTGLTASAQATVLIDRVQFDATTNTYAADVRLRNDSTTVIGKAALFFAGLAAGASISDASGTDASGNAYLNVGSGFLPRGLGAGAISNPVRLVLTDRGQQHFSLAPTILTAAAQPPVLSTIGPLTVQPGGHLNTTLQATDPDGYPVTFSLRNANSLPNSHLAGNVLTLTPTPAQIGHYTFTIVASDGALEATQDVTLDVVADPNTTTRLSGVVHDAGGNPLAGVPVQLGADQTTTAADGTFTLQLPDNPADGTVNIHGDQVAGAHLPSLPEDAGLLLGHGITVGVNNVIGQPFVLPTLDVAHAATINPAQNQTLTNPTVPGLSVQVNAGTLKNPDGSPFVGALSLTQVPAADAPADLPATLNPSSLFIIDPGNLSFTSPAAVTLANTSGFAAGTAFDLWSLNPSSGQFENIGAMQVSADGGSIGTFSGGLTHTGWALASLRSPVAPSPDLAPATNPRNVANVGPQDTLQRSAFGTTDVGTGNVVMTHDVVAYSSLDQAHGLRLTYNSLDADPRPIVHFGFDTTPSDPSLRLVADVTLQRGALSMQVPGVPAGQYGLSGGQHVWALPSGGGPSGTGPLDVALQADLGNLPSGKYDYTVNQGFERFDGTSFSGSTVAEQGSLVSVNTIASPLGSGWGLQGIVQLVQNPDSSVMLIDGDGTDVVFGAPTASGANYVAPAGEFSTLVKNANGTFTWTTKDATDFSFDTSGRMVSTVDRHQNLTKFGYDSAGRLSQITDPVGLVTRFSLGPHGRISTITDPAGRVTQLEYDTSGNLIQITDPDASQVKFGYDGQHHMIQQTDQLGRVEQMTYDFAGRAQQATRVDGSVIQFHPLETVGLLPTAATVAPLSPPVAGAANSPSSLSSDGNGNIKSDQLDGNGQLVQTVDALGPGTRLYRNSQNEVVLSESGLNNPTAYRYDAQGNVIEQADAVSGKRVYVIASHNEQENLAVLTGLSGAGFTVTLGQTVDQFDGHEISKLPFYSAVVLLEDAPGSVTDMPAAGQKALVAYLTGTSYANSAGNLGGLVVDGGLMADASASGPFATLFPYLPATSGGFVTGTSTTDTQATADPNIDQDLTASFTLPTPVVPRSGTAGEAALTAKSGATVFYTSNLTGQPAVVGGTIPPVNPAGSLQGHIVSFSTLFTSDELSNTTLGTLMGNAVRWAAQGDTFNNPLRFTYDPHFNLVTSTTDSTGFETRFDRDPANGNLLKVTQGIYPPDPSSGGEATTFTYTPQGQISTITDAAGSVTAYQYNPQGMVESITYAQGTPDEGTVHYEYDAAGNRSAVIDENGNRTQYQYDAMNRLVKVIQPATAALPASVTVFKYDLAGNQLSVTDARGNQTQMQYDALDRLVKTNDPKNGTQVLRYDPQGDLAASVDQNGNTTQFRYDARSRLVDTIDPAGGMTSRTYDAHNNVASLTDPAGNVTQFGYTPRDLLQATINPLGQVQTYQLFDADNHLVYQQDANGQEIDFAHDSFGHVVGEYSSSNGQPLATFSYDVDGRLASASGRSNTSDAFSTVSLTYDARGRVKTVESVDKALAGAPDVVLTYGYDPAGNRTSTAETINGSAGAVDQATFDALNQLIELTQTGGGTSDKRVDLGFNAVGSLTSIDRFADLAGTREVAQTTTVFDTLNRPTSVSDAHGATTLDFEQLGYDAAGQATSRANSDNSLVYSYDATNQLTAVTPAAGGAAVENYAYDANGNRAPASGQGSGYQTGPANQLLSDGAFNYAYDHVGNLVRRTEIATGNARVFSYDYRNRLVEVQDLDSGGKLLRDIKFTYDPLNRLISRSENDNPASGQPAPVEYFAYDGRNVRLDFLLPAGSTTPALKERYLDGPRIDQVFAQDAGGGNVLWLLNDHLGSTTDLVDNTGTVKNHIVYDSFGRVVSQSDPAVTSRFLFAAGQYDGQLSLYLDGARDYDPAMGRFLREDPLGIFGPDDNLYRYVGNDPLSFIDPSGLCPEQHDPPPPPPPSPQDQQADSDTSHLKFVPLNGPATDENGNPIFPDTSGMHPKDANPIHSTTGPKGEVIHWEGDVTIVNGVLIIDFGGKATVTFPDGRSVTEFGGNKVPLSNLERLLEPIKMTLPDGTTPTGGGSVSNPGLSM